MTDNLLIMLIQLLLASDDNLRPKGQLKLNVHTVWPGQKKLQWVEGPLRNHKRRIILATLVSFWRSDCKGVADNILSDNSHLSRL